MAMKKRVAASMAAVLMTALCFGSTALAADADNPVNGSGDTATPDSQTEVKLSYKLEAGAPTWSVDIPQTIAFSDISVNSPQSALVKDLAYSSVINNNVEDATSKITKLEIKLPDGDAANTFTMFNADAAGDPAKVAGAYGVVAAGAAADKDGLFTTVAAGGTIVTMTEDVADGTGKVQLDKTKLKDFKDGNYKGNLTVSITPTTEAVTPAP